MKKLPIEKTFVMIKPDGVARGLIGKIMKRFEEQGLKLEAARMVWPTKDQVNEHYPGDNVEWLTALASKTFKNYNNDLDEVKADFGTTEPVKVAKMIFQGFINYLTTGPVIISVWSGNHAIQRVRKTVGHAVTTDSEVGSIRDAYGFDTPLFAVKSGRIVFRNLIHASDSPEEVEREIKIWFGEGYKGLGDYERIDYLEMIN